MRQLIDKFWAGTATDAEKQQLADGLDAPDTDWRQELRREFDQQQWQADGPLTEQQAKRVLLRLHRQIRGEAAPQPSFGIWRNRMRWAAAAVVLLVAGLAVWLHIRPTSTVSPIVQQSANTDWHLTRQANLTNRPMTIHLADGSRMTLEPGSSVSYYEPFGKAARTISLTGTGFFAVAKDRAHPFTVLANGVTTTALGTRFRVRAIGVHQVSVQLLEGRVVVRATPASGMSLADTYLQPGQELHINTKTNKLTTRQLTNAKAGVPDSPQGQAQPVPVQPPPGLSFTKEPLNDVFAKIGQRYHVQIDYDPATVQGLSFSGSFQSTDSLRVVLGAICTMNELMFTQQDDRLIISRLP